MKELREAFNSGRTRSFEWRQHQLEQLIRLMDENRAEIAEGLKLDLGTNPFQASFLEIDRSINEARYALQHLEDWMAPEEKGVPLVVLPAQAIVVKEPLGTVLLISYTQFPV